MANNYHDNGSVKTC